MRKSIENIISVILTAVALCSCVLSQAAPEVYTGMLIASEAVAGKGAGRINIRIMAYTTDAEKTSLKNAFQKSQDDGMALLRTMDKGFINIEGQPGRKIYAVFSRNLQKGHEVIIVSEHVASGLEKWNNVDVKQHPLAVVDMRFNDSGDPVKGEVFPAVKLNITADGYPDVQTDDSNKVIMTELARK